MKFLTNREIADLLQRVKAAYQILGENRFKIIAYDKAADSIAHLTQELKDVWENKKLDDVSGIGPSIAKHIDELFRTGHVTHFQQVLGKLPQSVYPLLLVPGIGPAKAFKLVTELGLKNEDTVIEDLKNAALHHKIAPMEGFGEKSESVILSGIESYSKGQIKENRLVLPEADAIASDVIAHIEKCSAVLRIDKLGSLRRQVATVGDIDLAAATNKPDMVIDHFITYPHEKIIDKGHAGSTMLLHSGRQVDLRVQTPEAYGAMLQYFTGSKHHNITLRTRALEKGLSLNEYGIKNIRTGKISTYADEEMFYKALGLPLIPPELREDHGEIEAGYAKKMPRLVTLRDIKGDLHMHMNFQYQSSHDLGSSSISDHLDLAAAMGYEYIGISDHNPSMSTMNSLEIKNIMKARKDYYEHEYYSWKKKNKKNVHILISCEVDILVDGTLALPVDAFDYVDMVIVSIHSSFTQQRNVMTQRIIKALTAHPKVRVFGHPTGRLLTKREGVDADWEQIFQVCRERDIALEINAHPERLDLPDLLVHEAVKKEVHLIIDTDSHHRDQMQLMRYGISVARRGWASARDIVNTLGYNEFRRWLLKGG